MGIDMTPNPTNPNYNDAATCLMPITHDDHITYDNVDGNIFYQYHTSTKSFQLLNLPRWFKVAPENVKHDTIEWVRRKAQGHNDDRPQSLIDYLNDPKTKMYRRQVIRGYASLEDFQ